MQNIDVRFSASSNFGKVKADLAALEAQAASLGSVLSKSAYAAPGTVDPARWKIAARGVHEASNAYRNAASSSGLFSTQQIRAISETERYTKALQKQKLTLGDIRKHSGIMREVYREQLRYQRMTAQYWGTDSAGRAITDIAVPKNVPKDLDSAAQRMHFFGEMTKSASTQVINMGKNMQWAGRQLTVGFTYPMSIVGVAAGVMAYKVEDSFGKINKVYDVSAQAMTNEAMRTKELADLRTDSMKMATDVAESYGLAVEKTLAVEQALAATGLQGGELLDTTKEVQRISALGDIDPSQTTEMVVALKNAFRDTIKDGDDLTNTLNFMNAASNATSLSLQDIAEATPRAASGLATLGVNAREMTVLLVAMRENGVEAAQGANALKSATTRILDPVSKASKFYEEYGINLQNLSKQSGGNLYDFIQRLGAEQEKIAGNTEKETRRLQASGVAALFGTYQYNRLFAALTNVNIAKDTQNNQTAKAIALMDASNEQLEKQAKLSEKAMMETGAAKFRKEWAKLQISLAKLGEPFLEAGSRILEVVGYVVDMVNGLSDSKKMILGVIAAATALAGPFVMLAGLTMNLTGQFARGIGSVLTTTTKWAGAVGLVNKEEAAAMRTAEAQNKVFQQQTTHVSTLAQEINVLAMSFQKATEAAVAYAGAQNLMTAPPAMIGPQTQTLGGKGVKGYQLSSMEQTYFSQQPSRERGRFLSQQVQLERARNAIAQDYMKANGQVARDATIQEKAQAKTTKSLNGANIAMGAMAVSAAAMMMPIGETGQEIAKWTMIGSLVVPALIATVGWLNKAAAASKVILMTQLASVRTAAVGTTAVSGLSLAMNVAKGSAVGFGVALNAALGPIGWIALSLTAIAGTFMAIKSHNDKIAEKNEEVLTKQLEATRIMNSSTASIATNLGKAAGSYSTIVGASGAGGGKGRDSEMLKAYNYYKGEEGSKELGALQSDGKLLETDRLMGIIRSKFIDLQVIGKDTAEQAKMDVQAMLMAAGASSVKAAAMADVVYKRYGDISKTNWVGPIKDQTDELARMANEAFRLSTTYVAGGYGMGAIVTDFEIDEGKKKLLYEQAEKSAQIFSEALMREADPVKAKVIISQYMDAATSQWQVGFEGLLASTGSGSEELKVLFAQHGIDSGKAFADAMRNNPEFEKAYDALIVSPKVNATLQGQLKYVEKFATEYEHAFISPLAESSGELEDSVLTAATALKQFADAGIGVTSDEAVDNLLTQNEAYKEYASIKAEIADLTMAGYADDSKEVLVLQEKLNKSGKRLIRVINALNTTFGFSTGKTVLKALTNLMNEVGQQADGAKGKVDKLGRAISGLPDHKTISIKMDQVGGIAQGAMSDTMGAMADSAMDKFNSGWDSRVAGVQAQQEAASNALEQRQQAAQDAFDARWERRRNAIEKAYQQKMDRVEREIEAEQRADEVRQRLFENEKARLQALADAANTNIDFNMALNEGRLDDAAKTLNNAQAKGDADQMDREQKAAEARTAARIKALEKKNERLEKQRDKEVKQLEKMEERMRKHLDRVQQARSNALQKEQEDYMDNLESRRDAEEAMLEQKLELFKAFVPRNKKELDKWIAQIGMSYDDFGTNVLAKGKTWAESFGSALKDNILIAATKIASDNAWEKAGKDMGEALLRGLGFDSLAAFNKFVRSGSLSNSKNKVDTRHEGGIVGTGGGSRGSIPNSFRGLHRTERMVRAQKGEYVINKKSSSEYGTILKSINDGSFDPARGIIGGAVPMDGDGAASMSNMYGAGNVGRMMMGVAASMFAKGVGAAFDNAYQKGLSKKKSKGGRGGRGGGGIGSSYVPGAGGRHGPTSSRVYGSIHDEYSGFPAIDIPVPTGSPAYAVADGRISRSEDLVGNDGRVSNGGYYSYGRVIQLKTDAGPEVLYAHLNSRGVGTGQRVKGGSIIGRTGNTGHSYGSHLHFGSKGASPTAWLRRGGKIRHDNTPVTAHRGETMLSQRLTKQFEDNVSGGSGGDTFNVTLDLRGAMIKDDVDIEKAVNKAIDQRESKVGRKRVVR